MTNWLVRCWNYLLSRCGRRWKCKDCQNPISDYVAMARHFKEKGHGSFIDRRTDSSIVFAT